MSVGAAGKAGWLKFVQCALLVAAVLARQGTHAAELTVLSTVGMRGGLEKARGEFERANSDRFDVTYGTAAVLKRRIENGAAFDVAILTRSMVEDLAGKGRILTSTVASVAKSGMGIAVKAGATPPDIGTRDALRRALLSAGAIAYTKEGQSGAAAGHLFEALGISGAIGDRVVLETRPGGGVLAVAEDKATLGIALISEIAAETSVELAGPLPAELQTYVVFAAGMSAGAKQPEACRRFIAFLGTAAARRGFRTMGLDSE